MIRVTADNRIDGLIAQCPRCLQGFEFFFYTPCRCPLCEEMIPPIYRLVDENAVLVQEAKVMHYRNGKNW